MLQLALESTNSHGYAWDTISDDLTWLGDATSAHPGQALGLDRLPNTRAELQARLHPDDRPDVEAALTAALAAREPFQLTYRVLGTGDSMRFWLDRGRPLPSTGDAPLTIVGSFSDVTEQHAVQSQLLQSQKLDAVELLAGGIAHDFNNLLSVIQGYGELLRDEFSASAPGLELLDEVLHAVRRATSLTRQLLIFSRRQVVHPQLLDVRDVVQGMYTLLERLLGEDLRLELHLPASMPRVFADPGQLEQVIINLAVNARDAMAHGGTIQLRLGETSQGWAFLEVRDTGTGIPADVQTRMFEPFFTTKPSGSGTGLGLSTVHGIVHQSGGTIVVDSEPGVGTTLRVELPPSSTEGTAAAPPTETTTPRTDRMSGELILVVEDEPVMAALVRRLLRNLGYDVMLANSVPEALFELSQLEQAPDLVITDMIMPGGTGRELAASLATSHPGVPVLFMSGHTEDALARHGGGRSAGMAFLEKPFTQDALARAVRSSIHPTSSARDTARRAPDLRGR